ncbi:MAG: Na+/H+ antiporter subunit E [Candidatus Omnitrophota bacterium]
MVRKFILYFCLSYAAWLLLYWPVGIGRVAGLQAILTGIVVALFVTFVFGEVKSPSIPLLQREIPLNPPFVKGEEGGLEIKRYFWFLYYIPIFIYYCIVANLDVAYRVLSPEMPINPGIVKVKTSLKSRVGLTALANSITLTPGTMTVDLSEDGYLYIHWINVQAQDVEKASRIIVSQFEKILRRIFE